MNVLLLAGLLFASSPSSTATLEVATGDWSDIPLLENRNFTDIGSLQAVGQVQEMLGKSDCVIPGQSKKRLNLTVPFLIHYTPAGNIDRVVLRRLGCTSVESLLGSVLLNLAQKGQYRATGRNAAGWYRSEFSLTSS